MTNPDAGGVRILLSTAPDDAAAERLARTLVEERLAACVNAVPRVRSIYRWKGAVEVAHEVLLVIKTTAAAVDAATVRLSALHPYDVPEVLVLSPGSGSAAYLAWVSGEVPDPSCTDSDRM